MSAQLLCERYLGAQHYFGAIKMPACHASGVAKFSICLKLKGKYKVGTEPAISEPQIDKTHNKRLRLTDARFMSVI